MISLLFVAVNSALLWTCTFFYSYNLFLDGISKLFVRISNALLITVGEFHGLCVCVCGGGGGGGGG